MLNAEWVGEGVMQKLRKLAAVVAVAATIGAAFSSLVAQAANGNGNGHAYGHELRSLSTCGTMRTNQPPLSLSAFGGKADIDDECN